MIAGLCNEGVSSLFAGKLAGSVLSLSNSDLQLFAAKAVTEDVEQPLEDREGADASLIYPRPAGAKGQEGIDFTSLSITGPSGNGVICTLQYRQRGRNCIISVCCQNYEFAWALQQSRKKKKEKKPQTHSNLSFL